MKAVIISDAHLHNHPLFAKPWRDGCNTRLQHQLENLAEVFELAVAEKCTHLFHLGDWFHTWREIYTPIHAVVTSFLYQALDATGLEFVTLLGNHDLINKASTKTSTLHAYSAHPRINLITEPVRMEFDYQPVTLIPYHQDHDWIKAEAIRLAHPEGVLFAHLDVKGAEASIEGYRSRTGVGLHELQDHYAYGTFGHYHMAQTLDPDGRFRYVGAPLQLNLGDLNQDRGCLIWDSKSPTPFRFSPLPGRKFHNIPAEKMDWQGGARDDYWILHCPSDVVHDVQAQGVGMGYHYLMTKPLPQLVIQNQNQEIHADPLRDWVDKNHKQLDPERLYRFGRSYLDVGL